MAHALTIGTFDGVHLGHQALLTSCARAGCERVTALCFDPHPALTLRPHAAPQRLMTFARKRDLLLACGATHVERLAPTPELLALDAVAFFEWACTRFAPTHIVEGEDFRFGAGRLGDVSLLCSLCAQRGITCQVLPPVHAELASLTTFRVSSTLSRQLLATGRVADAACLLSRPHELSGTVVAGDRLGRTVGIPTCNLDTPCMLPADGVYAGVARLPDGSTHPAAINVGTRPTVQGVDRRVEAHLLLPGRAGAWSPVQGLPEYHWPLTLELHAFVRDSVRFPDLPTLRAQIERDIARVGLLLGATA